MATSGNDLNPLNEEIDLNLQKPNEYDAMFSLERREQMLAHASRDIEGRPVVYYRFMPKVMLDKLIETGEIDAPDHFDNPDEPIDRAVTEALYRWLHAQDREEVNYTRDLEGMLLQTDPVNPSFGHDIRELALNNKLTPRFVQPVFADHVDTDTVKGWHAGGRGSQQVMSPYLSMSVGGIIVDFLRENQVYVEMVIPDEFVELNPMVPDIEKEVLTKQIRREWITRVYTDQERLYDEIILNPQTAIGAYRQQHPDIGILDAVDAWRTYEATENYLPVSLMEEMKSIKDSNRYDR